MSRKLNEQFRNLQNAWCATDFDNERANLRVFEQDKDGHSVNFELEGLLESLTMPMEHIQEGQVVPHATAVKVMMELLGTNDILDGWKQGDGKQYPAILKWLEKADDFRKALIDEL